MKWSEPSYLLRAVSLVRLLETHDHRFVADVENAADLKAKRIDVRNGFAPPNSEKNSYWIQSVLVPYGHCENLSD